jgi:CubicO group peptidase (beta-lactamase class C family)
MKPIGDGCRINQYKQPLPAHIPKGLFTSLQAVLAVAVALGAVAGPPVTELRETLDQLVQKQAIVGAQVIIGQNQTILLEHGTGKRSPEGAAPVDKDTLFCIGSDSKPMVAALIMTMVADGTLRLDAPVSQWLPAFASLRLKDGTPARRPPTLRELLSHRSGIFSQKQDATPRQLSLIHNFACPLAESVDGISREPLLSQPGEAFAYSGAGYCVLGRAAEVAGRRTLEELLQVQICRPLQLSRTTYFPIHQANVAIGGSREGGRLVAHRRAPHLRGQQLRFTLVGGSIYSTARDQARFARMVLGQGRLDGKVLFPPSVWTEWLQRQPSHPEYGLGWFETFGKAGNLPLRLAHEGEAAGYRALIIVNLRNGFFCVANWTPVLPGGRAEAEVAIHSAIRRCEEAAKVGAQQ